MSIFTAVLKRTKTILINPASKKNKPSLNTSLCHLKKHKFTALYNSHVLAARDDGTCIGKLVKA